MSKVLVELIDRGQSVLLEGGWVVTPMEKDSQGRVRIFAEETRPGHDGAGPSYRKNSFWVDREFFANPKVRAIEEIPVTDR